MRLGSAGGGGRAWEVEEEVEEEADTPGSGGGGLENPLLVAAHLCQVQRDW